MIQQLLQLRINSEMEFGGKPKPTKDLIKEVWLPFRLVVGDLVDLGSINGDVELAVVDTILCKKSASGTYNLYATLSITHAKPLVLAQELCVDGWTDE